MDVNGNPYNWENDSDPYNLPEVFVAPLYTYVHSIFLATAAVILFTAGLYASVISPLFSFFVFKNVGYAHRSRVITMLLSFLLSVSILGGVIYATFLDHQTWSFTFIEMMSSGWKLAQYWMHDERYLIQSALFWYCYPLMWWATIMNVIGTLLSCPKTLAPERSTLASSRHAFVICAHNSSEGLPITLKALLKLVAPHQIFVADNGSTDQEKDATDAVCHQLSLEVVPDGSSTIQVIHIPYGNKTLAQYSVIYRLHQQKSNGNSAIDIITILDDDVIIPPNWPAEGIESQLNDPATIALCYPLTAANANESLTAAFQDVEYINGFIFRFAYDTLGTQLFASGAIATWRLDSLLSVLERHCTVFNGEDLEMGYIVHKLSGRQGDKLRTHGGSAALDTDSNSSGSTQTRLIDYARIGLVKDCIIPTIVPSCWIHWYDVLPNPLKRKMAIKEHGCGEKSFFNQRLRSWDCAGYQYFGKMLKVLFSPGGWTYRPKVVVRFITLLKTIGILRELAAFVGFIWSLTIVRSGAGFVTLLIFYADSIFINWAMQFVSVLFQSWFCLSRIGWSLRPDVMLWAITLLDVPYILILRPIGLIYSLTYYVFFQPFKADVRTQLENDAEMRRILRDE